MQQSAISVDTDHLFKTVPRYFSSLESAVKELVQNARRSQVDKPTWSLRIQVEGDTLTFVDPGRGIDDIGQALSLASTDWEEPVASEEDPAGMGLVAALANATQVTIRSMFGSLTIDCDRFFNDADYRHRLVDEIDEDSKDLAGTIISMVCKDNIPASLSRWVQSCIACDATASVTVGGSFVDAFSDMALVVSTDDFDVYHHNCGYREKSTGVLISHKGQLVKTPAMGYGNFAEEGELAKVELFLKEQDCYSRFIVVPKDLSDIEFVLPHREEIAVSESNTLYMRNVLRKMVQLSAKRRVVSERLQGLSPCVTTEDGLRLLALDYIRSKGAIVSDDHGNLWSAEDLENHEYAILDDNDLFYVKEDGNVESVSMLFHYSSNVSAEDLGVKYVNFRYRADYLEVFCRVWNFGVTVLDDEVVGFLFRGDLTDLEDIHHTIRTSKKDDKVIVEGGASIKYHSTLEQTVFATVEPCEDYDADFTYFVSPHATRGDMQEALESAVSNDNDNHYDSEKLYQTIANAVSQKFGGLIIGDLASNAYSWRKQSAPDRVEIDFEKGTATAYHPDGTTEHWDCLL